MTVFVISEPKTRRPLKDVLRLPEAYLMLWDTIIAFDNVFRDFKSFITLIPMKLRWRKVTKLQHK
ncbi:CFC_collapsed_G0057540.mRNA.1.CDS.1 [Saccharomyces cerevisiae]|nr:CFC_collapsed_G0057540.mRNA.1.CDS.1 [Saccharomyces cerevisiae]